MIISASRRTDIPAFFPQWFIHCIQKGSCIVKNPFNPTQSKVVSLMPQDVDIIAFWTRYPEPLLKYLNELDEKGYSYLFLYTITGYPRWLEPNAKERDESIEVFCTLSRKIGQQKVIWRYDPVIFSKDLDFDFHLNNFEAIAKKLHGYTQRVIISIMEPYKKVQRRLSAFTEQNIILDPFATFTENALHNFFVSLREIASLYALHIQSCCSDISRFGIPNGACIDAELIRSITKTDTIFTKDTHQRTHCLCAKSIDIGTYNTCKFGCIYCYANR